MNQKGLTLITILLLLAFAISGYLIYQNRTNLVIKFPQNTKSPTALTDKSANWKIYTDAKNNFSFRYPTDWYLKENDIKNNRFTTLLEVKSPEKQLDEYNKMSLYEVAVAIKDNKEKLTLDQEVNQFLGEPRSPGIILKERNKFKIDAKEAEKLRFAQDTGVENIVIIAINKDKIYIINFTANFITDNLPNQFENEFKTNTDQTLSLFKFL